MRARPKRPISVNRPRPRNEPARASAASAQPLADRVKQIAFGVTLLGAGLGPLAPTFEGTPSLRLIVQMFFILAGALWLMSMALEGRVRIRRTRLGPFLLLLIAALLGATVNAAYKFPALLTLFSWGAGIVAFLFVVNETRSRRWRMLLFLAIAASMFIVALHGLHQVAIDLPKAREQFNRDPSSVLRDLHLPPDTAFDLQGRLEKDRVFSTFLLPNSLAGFLVLVLPGFVGLMLDNWTSRLGRRPALTQLALQGLMLGGVLLALFFTGSKGGWMSFLLAGVVFVLWAFGRALWARRMQILCAILGLLTIWGIAQASGLLPPLRDYGGSYSVRYGYWRAGAEMFGDHPMLGVGLDNFADYYAMEKRAEDQDARRAHNDYVQIAVEMGVLGLFAYALFWYRFWRRTTGVEEELLLPEAAPPLPIRAGLTGVLALSIGVLLIENFCGGTLRTRPGIHGWGWVVTLWLGWLLFFILSTPRTDTTALGRTSYATIGVGCGLIAFLFHSLGDFDHYVGAILQTAWLLMGLFLSARMSEEREAFAVDRPIGPLPRLALVVLPMAVALAIMYGFVLRVTESQVLHERAMAPEAPSMEQRLEDARLAVESNPLDAQNQALLSDLYLHQWLGNRRTHDAALLSQAIVHASAATQLSPKRSENFTRLGHLYEIRWLLPNGSIQDYQDAIAAYRTAEELFPSNPITALNVARLTDLIGQYDVASGKYFRARRLSEEQYHIPRKFTEAELKEIDARIRTLTTAWAAHTRPPAMEFRQPYLLGWPRETPIAVAAPLPSH